MTGPWLWTGVDHHGGTEQYLVNMDTGATIAFVGLRRLPGEEPYTWQITLTTATLPVGRHVLVYCDDLQDANDTLSKIGRELGAEVFE